jgi:hypothetical protein
MDNVYAVKSADSLHAPSPPPLGERVGVRGYMLRVIIRSPLTLILSPPRDKLGICDKGRGDFFVVKYIGVFLNICTR